MKKMLESNNITEELEYQESLIDNKIRYLSLIKKSIGIAKTKVASDEDLFSLITELQQIFKGWVKEFHNDSSSDKPSKKHDKDKHNKIMELLRKFSAEEVDEKEYLKLLEFIPQLKDDDFLSKYFIMLRVLKNSNFKLDEIDSIEKNIKKFVKSLESDIM